MRHRLFSPDLPNPGIFSSLTSPAAAMLLGGLLSLSATAVWAKGEATNIYTSPGNAAAQATYVTGGNAYNWGQGDDGSGTNGNLLIDGFSLDNGSTRYDYQSVADLVRVVRRNNGTSCGLFAETTGTTNNYRPDFPGNLDGTGCDMAAVMAGRVINVGALDVFNNVGSEAKDIERVDFIFSAGITAVQAADLEKAGHVVTEKSGNNSVKIAAITALDSSGNPSSYGTLVTVNAGGAGCPGGANDICYGVVGNPRTNDFLHTSDSSVPPSLVGGGSEQLGLAFVSQADLGLAAGEIYYGFSYFAPDVDPASNPAHVLTDPNTFPSDTYRAGAGPGDADMYGGTAGYFVLNTLLRTVSGDVVDGSGTTGIAAVTVRLHRDDGDTAGEYDANDTLVESLETGSDGSYSFSRVLDGSYIVRVDAADPELTGPGYTTGTESVAVTVAGADLSGQRFSFNLPQIAGSVFNDADGNGSLDPGEGVQGVTVRLYRDAAMTSQVGSDQVTDANGQFLFADIQNGTYYLHVDQAGSISLDGLVTSTANPLQIAVQNGANVTTSFPFVPLGPATWTLSGTVFRDEDGDGQQAGSGETGIGGVDVTLIDSAGNQAGSTTTAADGSYTFGNIVGGSYTVRVDSADSPEGYAISNDSRDVNLVADTTIDFPFGVDSDADGVPDGDDIDDDNDGILDSAEQNGGSDEDTDGDGVVDRLDLDSDNDGILDARESGADQSSIAIDSAGRIDTAANPVGSNGLVSTLEEADTSSTPVVYNGGVPLDTDADGVADFRDLDSDNDGITDVIEAGGADPDSNALIGSGSGGALGVNGAGIATALAAGGLVPPDTDRDGTPDFRDLDSDNDGRNDVIEAGGSDPDGNGLIGSGSGSALGVDQNGLATSLAAGGLVPPDSDGNGTPDYRQRPEEPPRLETGLDGGLGCTLSNNRSIDPLFPLLLLFALGYLLRGRGAAGTSPLLALVVAGVTMQLMVIPPALAATEFQGRWYGGLGVGISELKPDPNTTVYTNEETRSGGGKLFLGYDWSERVSFEGYYSDQGEARIGSTDPNVPGGDVAYRDYGLSALYYLFKQHQAHEGFGLFGRIGYGKMENQTDLPYTRVNDTHMMLGAGLEYAFRNGFALRGEFDYYDTDSQLLALSLLKRFGGSKPEEPAPAPQPEPAPAPVAVAPPPPPKHEPQPQPALEVKLGRLGIVYFETDSSLLSATARSTLDEVAAELQRVPRARVEVQGNTDSRASDAYNMALSERRARAVIDYLASKGIARERMILRAFGESNPVAGNDTAEGRRLNRRVEFREIGR